MSSSNLGNLLSNYGSRLWSLVSVFIFIPFYIRYLGIESYAIIGFYALILGLVGFADAGMSSAIIKEFANNSSASKKFSILRVIEKYYLCICIILFITIFFLSEFIAKNWLTSNTFSAEELCYYIKLIGFGIVLQLLSSLYYGALFGLNLQVRANSFQIFWNIFKSGFVILLLIWVSPTLEVFFTWQILCNFAYVILLRVNVISELKRLDSQLIVSLKRLPKEIVDYIVGMAFIAIISSINIQADKIITSYFFSLKIFGLYNVASTLSQIPVIVTTPLVTSVFPLFSKFSSESNERQLQIIYKKATFLLHIIVFPVLITLVLYIDEIIDLWVGKSLDGIYRDELVFVAKLLSIGSLFLAIQFLPYYVLLSKGKTKYTIYQGIFQVAIGLPLLYFSVVKYSLIGAGIPWIIINFLAFIFLSYIVLRKYVKVDVKSFLVKYFIIPFVVTAIIFVAINRFHLYILHGPFYLFVALSFLLSISLNIFVYNFLSRKKLFNLTNIYDFSNE